MWLDFCHTGEKKARKKGVWEVVEVKCKLQLKRQGQGQCGWRLQITTTGQCGMEEFLTTDEHECRVRAVSMNLRNSRAFFIKPCR